MATDPGARGEAGSIHVLVLGIENSLWLGSQFCADLSLLFPWLNCVAMSANRVLGLVQDSIHHIRSHNWTLNSMNFRLAPEAIVLSISQSGGTYPTVWATRVLASQTASVFCMSHCFETPLAQAVAEDTAAGEFNGIA